MASFQAAARFVYDPREIAIGEFIDWSDAIVESVFVCYVEKTCLSSITEYSLIKYRCQLFLIQSVLFDQRDY